MKTKTLPFLKAARAAFVVLLFVFAGLTQVKAQTITVDRLNYNLNEDGITVTVIGFADGVDDTGELIIPDAITQWGNTYPVTAIGEWAFYSRRGITSVHIGNSVTSIQSYSFAYSGTTSIDISNSVTSFGSGVFENAYLTSVTVPSNVTYMGWGVFNWCPNLTSVNYNATNCGGSDGWFDACDALTNLTIGDNVQVIPNGFVSNRSSLVGELFIPASVTTIGNYAFNGCSGFTGGLDIPSSVTSIGSHAFSGCTGFTGSLDIPDNVTTIGSFAFDGCTGFTGNMEIPGSVTTIGEQAFHNCMGFSGTLTLGLSLTRIDNSAFFGACENFTSLVVLAENPPTLGTNVFTSVDFNIPVQVPCGSSDAYQNASGWSSFVNFQEPSPCEWIIEAAVRPNNGGTVSGTGTYVQGETCTLTATAIDDFSFSHWTEDGVTVSTDATYSFVVEGNHSFVAHFTNPNFIVFADPNVESHCVELWDTNGDGFLSYEEAAAVTSLDYSFRDWSHITSFDELQYFTGLTTIQSWEMSGCNNLTSITLPESLTTISYAAFEYSNALQSIVIPESVTYIGGWSFSYCYALTSIVLNSSTPPEISDDCPFCYTNVDNVVVTVPCGAKNTYQNTYVWDWFPNYQEPEDCMYDITVTIVLEEAGTVDGVGSYQNGTTCTLTAIPAAGCSFINWTEDGNVISTDAELSFTVTGERNLVANFALPNFIVSLEANPKMGGEVSFSDGSSLSFDFEDGTLQGWTAVDADGDGRNWYASNEIGSHGGSYKASSWSWYGNVSYDPDNYLISPEITNASGITYYIATNTGWPDHYGLYVSSTGNNINDFSLLYEETVPISKGTVIGKKVPAEGVDLRAGMSPWTERTIELPQGTKYVAFRHYNSYDMNYIFIDDISFITSSVAASYQQGSSCTIMATPNYGYEFVNWEENGEEVTTETEYSFTVTADRNFVANFAKVPFAINATPNFDDRGSVSGTGEYVIDETCTLTATPNSGHNFVRWMENGQVVSTEATYSFTVDGPHNLVAVFSAHVDDIIVFADPNVKAICVNNWDTDGDTELTYAEAAAVTNLGNKFQNHYDDITSFDELQYFTGLTYINDYEFYNCNNLSSIVLPENITSIGYQAFIYCYSLGGTLTIGENVNYIGWGAFMRTNFSTIHYNAVNCEMGGQWIDGATSSLTTLTIGENVEVIPYSAFQDCYNVTGELVIPNSVNHIGENAFNNCYGLSAVIMPEGITTIEQGTFGWCSNLESINIPETVETIGNYAFSSCNSLKNLVLPSSLTFIGTQAFDYCYSLTGTLDIPDLVTYIGFEAFMGCTGFSELVLPDNIQTIGGRAFKDCSGLRGEVTLPEALESISGNAFSGCDGISTINYNATNCYEMGGSSDPVFNDCAIEHINIGANVQSIPNFAFRRCSLVTDMHVAATLPPTIYSSTFGMVPRSIPVLVPSGSGDAYRNAQYWEEFFNIMEDGEQYSFHWDVDAHQYAHNLSVIGIIQINGVEQTSPALEIGAFCGDECRGRQMLTAYPDLNRSLVFLTVFGEEGDLITFRLYDHEAEEESALACATVLTFEADAIIGSYNEPEPLNFVEMQNTAVEAGWTWFSTYIDADGAELLQMMEESLGENGVMIKSHTDGFVSYDENGWMGNLTSVNPESMYMVNTSAPAVVSITGPFADAAQHPITINSGWTWVGYPVTRARSLNNVLGGFDAQDGDLIKMQDAFSQYIEGIGWKGALKTLVPGEGLMYHSLNSGTTTLTYVTGAKDDVLEKNITAEGNHWIANTKAYPFNMSVMAVIDLDGVEARDARYELGAFYGDECRGSARLMYVESLDRYLAFVSVSGNSAADLVWLLFDNENKEVYRADEGLHFDPNAILGAAKDPLRVSFSGLMGTEELMQLVSCYPNPVSRNEYVRLGLPAFRGSEARVEIMNAQGVMVSSARVDALTPEVKAPAAAGVYVMRVTIDGKGVVYAKLIVE